MVKLTMPLLTGAWLVALLIGLVLAPGLSPRVAAQTPTPTPDAPQVFVMYRQAQDSAHGMRLQTFFTVREKGVPLGFDRVKNVSLEVGGLAGQNVRDSPPNLPFKIALLLDESGSIRDRGWTDDVQRAVLTAIGKAPADAQIAIFTFADIDPQQSFAPRLPFTNKDEALSWMQQDGNYNPVSGNPTCLYDAGQRLLDYFKERVTADERRAIILFTDGVDERGNGQPCSRSTLQMLIDRIKLEQQAGVFVPIFTVGLCAGARDCAEFRDPEAPIRRIAAATNALSLSASDTDLGRAFEQVMADLESQRYVEALLFPCQDNRAILRVELTGVDQPIETVVPFEPPRCYAPRASATLTVNEPRSEGGGVSHYPIQVTLQNTSPLPIEPQRLVARLVKPNGERRDLGQVDLRAPPGASADGEIRIPQTIFDQQGDYRIELTATSERGDPFRPSDGEALKRACGEIANADVIIGCVKWQPTPLPPLTFSIVGGQQSGPGEPSAQLILRLSDPERLRASGGPVSYVVTDQSQCGIDSTPRVLDLGTTSAANPQVAVSVNLKQPLDRSRTCNVQVTLQFSLEGRPQPPVISENVYELPLAAPPFWARYIQPAGIGLAVLATLAAVTLAVRLIPRQRRPKPYTPPDDTKPPSPATPAMPRPGLLVKVIRTVEQNQQIEQEFTRFPVVIGRKEGNIVIHGDPKLSRRQVQIDRDDGGFILTDLSTYGTRIGERRLKRGEQIRLNGKTVVKLSDNTIVELTPQP